MWTNLWHLKILKLTLDSRLLQTCVAAEYIEYFRMVFYWVVYLDLNFVYTHTIAGNIIVDG